MDYSNYYRQDDIDLKSIKSRLNPLKWKMMICQKDHGYRKKSNQWGFTLINHKVTLYGETDVTRPHKKQV